METEIELKKFMKAVVYTKYGPPEVLHLKEVEKPTPLDNEILIKIHATSVTMGDCELRSLKFSGMLKYLMRLGLGFRGPRKKRSIPGQELAGEIEAVGSEVKLFKPGDSVCASTGFHFGAYAEYVCLPEDAEIAIKPTNMTYEEAAVIPVGGMEALHYIKKANIQKGQTMLISGASGSIGTFAIQLAKYYGADVTAVGNPTSLEVMKSLGADYVVDYTKDDFTQSGETYDFIFDVIGKSSLTNCLSSLNEGGVFLNANPQLKLINHQKKVSKRSGIKLISRNMDKPNERIEQLYMLNELIEAKKIKSVIDKTYSLKKIVEAHSYVEKGQKIGNVSISLKEFL